MRALILVLLFAGLLNAQPSAPAPSPNVIVNQPVAGNFPRDLLGPVDPRGPDGSCNVGPCIWGNADSATAPTTFFPPAGYRTVITAIRGNVMAFIKSLPGDPPTPVGSAAGILGGFQSTSSGQAAQCDLCASGCPVFVLGAVSEKQDISVVNFNYTGLHFLLDPDNVFIPKIAEFLNTTGKPIHIELTYTLEFQWEKIVSSPL